jgi:hypothetical protein
MRKIHKKNNKSIHWINHVIFLISIIIIGSIISTSVISFATGVSITEIMFNPQGSDSGREWIEITLNKSDGCINLSEYKVFEEGINHKISHIVTKLLAITP